MTGLKRVGTYFVASQSFLYGSSQPQIGCAIRQEQATISTAFIYTAFKCIAAFSIAFGTPPVNEYSVRICVHDTASV